MSLVVFHSEDFGAVSANENTYPTNQAVDASKEDVQSIKEAFGDLGVTVGKPEDLDSEASGKKDKTEAPSGASGTSGTKTTNS